MANSGNKSTLIYTQDRQSALCYLNKARKIEKQKLPIKLKEYFNENDLFIQKVLRADRYDIDILIFLPINVASELIMKEISIEDIRKARDHINKHSELRHMYREEEEKLILKAQRIDCIYKDACSHYTNQLKQRLEIKFGTDPNFPMNYGEYSHLDHSINISDIFTSESSFVTSAHEVTHGLNDEERVRFIKDDLFQYFDASIVDEKSFTAFLDKFEIRNKERIHILQTILSNFEYTTREEIKGILDDYPDLLERTNLDKNDETIKNQINEILTTLKTASRIICFQMNQGYQRIAVKLYEKHERLLTGKDTSLLDKLCEMFQINEEIYENQIEKLNELGPRLVENLLTNFEVNDFLKDLNQSKDVDLLNIIKDIAKFQNEELNNILGSLTKREWYQTYKKNYEILVKSSV